MHLARRPSLVIIRHWSDDLEAALEGLSPFAARFEAGATDARGCLRRMARFADGLVALTVPREVGRDLSAANEFGKARRAGDRRGAKGIDLGSFPLLRKLEVQRAADLSALSLLQGLWLYSGLRTAADWEECAATIAATATGKTTPQRGSRS